MKHKVAIITASSRGMGAACAKELAENNYHVVLMSTTDSVLALADELGGKGLIGNVTNPDDLQNLVDLAVESYDQVDAVINNTGHPPKGELLEITDAD
jgi:NAD(P)-dependent dehydrogenase (short-subunit alcohol dehydrogenase family)